MKEEFKNRWIEFLLFFILGIVFAVLSQNESYSVDSRTSFAFLSGCSFAVLIDFLSRHAASKTLEFFRKKDKL